VITVTAADTLSPKLTEVEMPVLRNFFSSRCQPWHSPAAFLCGSPTHASPRIPEQKSLAVKAWTRLNSLALRYLERARAQRGQH